jgi:predicted transcriptional regulator
MIEGYVISNMLKAHGGQAPICEKLGVSHPTVSLTISRARSNEAVKRLICKTLSMPFDLVWGEQKTKPPTKNQQKTLDIIGHQSLTINSLSLASNSPYKNTASLCKRLERLGFLDYHKKEVERGPKKVFLTELGKSFLEVVG